MAKLRREKFSIVANQSDIDRAINWANNAIDEEGISASVKSRVDVALDEILTNIVSYGFVDKLASCVDLQIDYEAESLTLTITDNGRPFDPTAAPEPEKYQDIKNAKIGGMGIAFVRKMTTSMHYRRQDGLNILTLIFDLPIDTN